jgi:mono/diheme cytochrome c family protein
MRRSHTLRSLPLFLALAACAPAGGDAAVPEQHDGAELYKRQSCNVCHGPHGDGSALAPALRGLAELWTAEELVRYLADPKAYAAGDERLREQAERYPQMMPPYGSLDEARRTALAEHVLELSKR